MYFGWPFLPCYVVCFDGPHSSLVKITNFVSMRPKLRCKLHRLLWVIKKWCDLIYKFCKNACFKLEISIDFNYVNNIFLQFLVCCYFFQPVSKVIPKRFDHKLNRDTTFDYVSDTTHTGFDEVSFYSIDTGIDVK